MPLSVFENDMLSTFFCAVDLRTLLVEQGKGKKRRRKQKQTSQEVVALEASTDSISMEASTDSILSSQSGHEDEEAKEHEEDQSAVDEVGMSLIKIGGELFLFGFVRYFSNIASNSQISSVYFVFRC